MLHSSLGFIPMIMTDKSLEEIVLVHVDINFRSCHRAHVCFFQQTDVHNFRLSGRWMYYCLYRSLVLTSGGVLLTADRPGQRLGVS